VFLGVGVLIVRWGFWFLLVYGLAWGELRPKGIAIFVGVWLAGFVGLPYVAIGDALFTALVAMLDVVLVLLVVKRDLRLW
jgi:hypothetical protein